MLYFSNYGLKGLCDEIAELFLEQWRHFECEENNKNVLSGAQKQDCFCLESFFVFSVWQSA